MPASRMIRLDDSAIARIKEFRARIAGATGGVPTNSETVRMAFTIANVYYDQATPIITSEFSDNPGENDA